MKKLLMSSIILLIFSASMFLFQASCKKDVQAETVNTASQPLGIVLFEKSSEIINASGVQTWVYQFWIANYDGTNSHQIPVTLPAGVSYYGNNAHLSPDGKKLFIYAHEIVSASLVSPYTNHYKDHLYSVNLDGTSFVDIANTDVTTNLTVNTQSPYAIAGVDGVY